jgi:hypothetical protein
MEFAKKNRGVFLFKNKKNRYAKTKKKRQKTCRWIKTFA